MDNNLVYNSDFSKGFNGWNISAGSYIINGSEISLSAPSNSQGSIFIRQTTDHLIPIVPLEEYTISFDIRLDTLTYDSAILYLTLFPYDKDFIYLPSDLNSVVHNATLTTLAQPLSSGQTVAILESTSGWDASVTHRYLGICSNLDWGYNRPTINLRIALKGISGNNVTLNNAYSGNTIPKGTKVREFTDANTYYYPSSFALKSLTKGTWVSKSATFTAPIDSDLSDNSRLRFARFVNLGFLFHGGGNGISIRNIRLTSSNGVQDFTEDKETKIEKNGEVNYVLDENDTSLFKITKTNLLISKEIIEL